MTNVPRNDAQNANNNNDEDNGDAVIEAHNAQDPVDAQSYDACKAHKSNVTKRQQSIEIFQDKLLKTLEAPQAPQAPENQDYLNLAMAAMATKIKSSLSNNEIMDLMEELEEIISRVCRQKRRWLEGQNLPVSTATAPIQPAVAGTSTDNNYFSGPGPQGPMAVPLQQYHDDPQYYQF